MYFQQQQQHKMSKTTKLVKALIVTNDVAGLKNLFDSKQLILKDERVCDPQGRALDDACVCIFRWNDIEPDTFRYLLQNGFYFLDKCDECSEKLYRNIDAIMHLARDLCKKDAAI
jgi:hypothetical protein